MGTTNILDLNNRLTKVEKENVAQNSYTSLKNKPKINGVTLTGNKSLADIGAAAAADLTTLAGDVGDKTQLNTTDKSSVVGAVNEVNGKIESIVDDSTNYCEIGDTLIQWRQENISTTANSTVSKRIDFPKSYSNQNYLAVLINPMAPDNVTAKAAAYSTTGFTAYVTDTESGTRYFSWIAIGKKA